MNRFIKDYIIERDNYIMKFEDDYLAVADKMSLEDYLKQESRDYKITRFLFGLDYSRIDIDWFPNSYNLLGLINYMKLIDSKDYYEINLIDYLNNCFDEDVYNKSFEIELKYRNKTKKDCHFYDSDDSEDQDIPREEFDDNDELEISKYILDFFKLHNINSNEDLQSWLDKTYEDYFKYIGLDINVL